MKTLCAILLTTVFSTASLFAEIKLPRDTLDYTQLKKAVEIAKEKSIPIVYILADKNMTGNPSRAIDAVIDATGNKRVLVFLDAAKKGDYFGKLSKDVQKSFNNGTYIPKFLVANSTGSSVAYYVSFGDFDRDSKKHLAEIKKKVRELGKQ